MGSEAGVGLTSFAIGSVSCPLKLTSWVTAGAMIDLLQMGIVGADCNFRSLQMKDGDRKQECKGGNAALQLIFPRIRGGRYVATFYGDHAIIRDSITRRLGRSLRGPCIPSIA